MTAERASAVTVVWDEAVRLAWEAQEYWRQVAEFPHEVERFRAEVEQWCRRSRPVSDSGEVGP